MTKYDWAEGVSLVTVIKFLYFLHVEIRHPVGLSHTLSSGTLPHLLLGSDRLSPVLEHTLSGGRVGRRGITFEKAHDG